MTPPEMEDSNDKRLLQNPWLSRAPMVFSPCQYEQHSVDPCFLG